MSTITLPRAVAEQMLGMLLKVEAELKNYYTTETEEVRVLYASIAALRAALAQQADPTDPGHDVDVLREHVRHLERRIRELHAQQAEPVQEPAPMPPFPPRIPMESRLRRVRHRR